MSGVLIAIPSGDWIPAEAAYRLPAIVATARAEGHQIALLNLRSYSPAANISSMFKLGLANPAINFFLTLDADMLVPFDVVPRLIAHDVDVVGVVYRARQSPHQRWGHPIGDLPEDVTGLHEFRWVGGGCVMIKRAVVEAIPGRHDITDEIGDITTSHDVNFCQEARAAGFKVYADMDLSRDTQHTAFLPLPL